MPSSSSLWATSVDASLDVSGRLERDRPVGDLGEAGAPGDVEDRGVGQVLAHALHDLDLERRVHRRERVVEDQHARVRDERAGERDALALPARHGEATVADDAVEPAELARRPPRRPAVRIASSMRVVVDLAPRAEQQVVAQRRREQQRLLGDDPDRLAQLGRVEVVERDAVERRRRRESGSMSPDAMPASVVLPEPGGPLTTTSSPGRDLEVEAVEEAPVRRR